MLFCHHSYEVTLNWVDLIISIRSFDINNLQLTVSLAMHGRIIKKTSSTSSSKGICTHTSSGHKSKSGFGNPVFNAAFYQFIFGLYLRLHNQSLIVLVRPNLVKITSFT